MRKDKDKQLKLYTKVDFIGLIITIIVIAFPFIVELPDKIKDYYFIFMMLFISMSGFYLAYINYYLKIDLTLKPKYHTTKIMPIFWGILFVIISTVVLIIAIYSIFN